jgi:beta-glucanase (GH16 family)
MRTLWGSCVVVLAVALLGARPQVPGAARMLFDDEFNGSSLNTSLWYRCYPWADENVGCTNNPSIELEWYHTPNVTVSGGFLQLTALKQQLRPKRPYTSGMVSTGGANCGPPLCNPSKHVPIGFQFLYGYMEMRAQFPPGDGMWPAFWLVPSDYSWPPEIDAMEWQGGTPTIDYATIHWRDKSGHLQQDGTSYDTHVDLSAGYHTYGVDWQRNAVTWYFDGTPIKTFTKTADIAHKPMYVIVNLAIGGWISFPNPQTKFPAVMSVDYVKVWTRKP